MDIDHALVIGGTGMLRRATVVIAESARKLTVVARTRTSLGTLAKLLSDSESHRYETLDWDQPDHFVGELRHLVREVGHPSLVLAWLHDMNLGPRVAVAVSTPETPCDFFQVIGSSATALMAGPRLCVSKWKL